MSSPIVSHKRNFIKDAVIGVHQKYSHNHRVQILAQRMVSILNKEFAERGPITILDIGCGDMQLAETIQYEISGGATLTCIDIHPLPVDFHDVPRWKKYLQFDGRHLPFKQNQFDAAIFCDVLHHDYGGLKQLLTEAARVAKYIIVKDHFEYSLYSRWILKALDFVGNWGYGITLPKAYFRQQEFNSLCNELGLEINRLDHGIDLYAHLPFVNRLINPKLQFIVLLQKQKGVAGT